MLTLLDKLRVIEATGVLGVDLSWLNGNYQRAVIRLRELAELRRRAELICFLWQSYSDAVDQAVDMFDKLLTRAHAPAQNELDEQLCRQRQTIQLSLTALRSSAGSSSTTPSPMRNCAHGSLPRFRARNW
jgi:hypothetical protein